MLYSEFVKLSVSVLWVVTYVVPYASNHIVYSLGFFIYSLTVNKMSDVDFEYHMLY